MFSSLPFLFYFHNSYFFQVHFLGSKILVTCRKRTILVGVNLVGDPAGFSACSCLLWHGILFPSGSMDALIDGD